VRWERFPSGARPAGLLAVRGFFCLMGACTGATLGWIGWGVVTPGDIFANGSYFVDPTLLALGLLGGFAGFKARSRRARIAVSATSALSAAFWLAVPDLWWAHPPPRRADDGGAVPAAEKVREAEGPSLTTQTRSDSLPTPDERVSFLARYLRLRSPVSDVAFDIDFHDNSTGLVRGPSDWRVWAGLRLPPGAMSSWLEETHPCEQKPSLELDKILPDIWKVSSEGRCLQRDGSTLIVHAHEDVLVFFADAH
jgi:hypothetical protein